MHPLVQVMARESHHEGKSVIHEHSLERQQILRKKGAREALCLIGSAVEVEDHLRKDSDWTFEKSITTHLGLCYEYVSEYLSHSIEKDDAVDEELALAVSNLGCLNYHWERSDQALQVLQTAYRLYEMLPDQCTDVCVATLRTRNDLVFLKLEQFNNDSGNLELVEEAKEILAGQVALLGEHHRYTLETMNTTAIALKRAGRLDDALELELRCLQRCKESLGPEDGLFNIITNNLSVIYKERGEFDKALKHLTTSLDGYLRSGNEKHRYTFHTLCNIASTYIQLGQYEKALEFCHRSQSGYEEMFGLANIGSIRQALNLSSIYKKLERSKDALKWALHSFKGCINLYGPVHLNTLWIMNNVMKAYESLGRPGEAYMWARDCLEGYRRLYGEEHELTREAVSWVAFYRLWEQTIGSSSL
jgi:tetratricopeptide (TPR) repeat protein